MVASVPGVDWMKEEPAEDYGKGRVWPVEEELEFDS